MAAVFMVAAILSVTVFIAAYVYWKIWTGKMKLFASPPMHTFFGHSLGFPSDPSELLEKVRDWLFDYDHNMLLFLGPHPFFLSSTPEHAEILLNSNKIITKSFEYSFLVPWLGTGLLISTGDKWRTRRKLLTPAFHYGILNDFAEVFQEQAQIFVEKLKPLAETGEVLNICTFATNCTLDIICETAMGVNCGAQHDAEGQYPKAVLNMCSLIQKRQVRAYIWPDFIYNLTKNGQEYNRAVKILHDFTLKVIKEKISKRKLKEERVVEKKRLSFLDILLDCHVRGEIDIEGLREEVDTFMFEGHDTTASGIFWTLYLLGRNPEALKKAQEEVDRVWGSKESKSLVDLARELEYLTCVVKESLRLYPPVPMMARDTQMPIDLGNGRILPAGSTFGIAPFALHRNPNVWEDPDAFIPERFLLENSVKRHPFAYVPFSAGPRNCIGQKFALLEEKIVLSNFLLHYDVASLQKPEDLDLSAEIILRTQSGLSVRISKRPTSKVSL